jgi:hypothetical protein
MFNRAWLRNIASGFLILFALLLLIWAAVNVWGQYELARHTYRDYQQRTYTERQETADRIASRCAVAFAPAEFIRGCLAEQLASHQEQYGVDFR